GSDTEVKLADRPATRPDRSIWSGAAAADRIGGVADDRLSGIVAIQRTTAGQDLEVVTAIKVAAERAAGQLILKPVKESAIAGKKLCLAIAGQVECDADTRAYLGTPAKFDSCGT